MNAGRLDRKVELHRPTSTADTFGQKVETYTKEADVWAMKKDVAATEGIEGEQVVARVRTEWTIRYRSDIRPTWRVVYDSKTYTIDGILEIGRREGLRLLTEQKDSDR